MVPPPPPHPTSSPTGGGGGGGKFAVRRPTKASSSSRKGVVSSTSKKPPTPSLSSSSKSKKKSLLRSDSTRSDISGNNSATAGIIEAAATTTSSSSAGLEGVSISSTSSFDIFNYKSFMYRQWNKWQRRIPILKKVQDHILRIPPRIRYGFVIFWFCWKIVLLLIFLIMFLRHNNNNNSADSDGIAKTVAGGTAIQQQLQQLQRQPSSSSSSSSIIRVLYIVTTLSEYNTGTRSTQKGQDRLAEVLIPVVKDGVNSMISNNNNYYTQYEVDVYLICAYNLLPDREQLIRDNLPDGVGLEVWDNAAPIGYDKKSSTKIADNTRALARQHRYVIKDKFQYYDLFVAFEDDMLIKHSHLDQFLKMSTQIDHLINEAPASLPDVPENLDDYTQTKFYGQMTKQQLSRLIPGFIRVEVLLNETQHGAQRNVLPIPRDYDFFNNGEEEKEEEHHIHPEICCYTDSGTYKGLPSSPSFDDVIIWETNVKAFSVRELPPLAQAEKSESSSSSLLDWVVLMIGPGKRLPKSELIGGYWSGREGAFGPDEKRPSGGDPTLIAQQGGWMATQSQLARMDIAGGLCQSTFLPPFDQPAYKHDGQESMNVEFWSGSYQFFTGVIGGCNMQRIISVHHPDDFSNHLIYHTANNKQRQLTRERMVRADHLFGQLNTVKKMAIQSKNSQK